MKTILVAEDHKNIREFCRAVLAEEGYRIVLAEDGAEAVAKCLVEAPDVVVLDIAMPRTSGLEALEQIKQFFPQMPVVLFTSHGDCLLDRRALLAAACVEKGGDLNELKRTVMRVLKQRVPESGGESLRMGLPPFPTRMEQA